MVWWVNLQGLGEIGRENLLKNAYFFCNFLQNFANRYVFSAIFCKFLQFFVGSSWFIVHCS